MFGGKVFQFCINKYLRNTCDYCVISYNISKQFRLITGDAGYKLRNITHHFT